MGNMERNKKIINDLCSTFFKFYPPQKVRRILVLGGVKVKKTMLIYYDKIYCDKYDKSKKIKELLKQKLPFEVLTEKKKKDKKTDVVFCITDSSFTIKLPSKPSKSYSFPLTKPSLGIEKLSFFISEKVIPKVVSFLQKEGIIPTPDGKKVLDALLNEPEGLRAIRETVKKILVIYNFPLNKNLMFFEDLVHDGIECLYANFAPKARYADVAEWVFALCQWLEQKIKRKIFQYYNEEAHKITFSSKMADADKEDKENKQDVEIAAEITHEQESDIDVKFAYQRTIEVSLMALEEKKTSKAAQYHKKKKRSLTAKLLTGGEF